MTPESPGEHIADSQDSEATCPGGFALDACKAAARLRKMSRDFRPSRVLTAMDEQPHFNHLVGETVGRVVCCDQVCTIKLEMLQRRQTGRYQIVYNPDNSL